MSQDFSTTVSPHVLLPVEDWAFGAKHYCRFPDIYPTEDQFLDEEQSDLYSLDNGIGAYPWFGILREVGKESEDTSRDMQNDCINDDHGKYISLPWRLHD